jgi:2-dehydro-3-deoxygluconokinase
MANVVCYGETLLRLTAPQNGTLLQLPSLGVNVGGAEANVAVSLTQPPCVWSAPSTITSCRRC